MKFKEEYEKMDQFPRWFTNKKLNFTKNLLYPNKHHQRQPHTIAVHFRSELDQLSRSITWQELREQVQVARKVLKNKFGIVKGDIIGAYAHNCPEVLVYMLAGASLGAIFTSGSPDFGPTAIIDRFSQTKPKILLSCNAVYYNGKVHEHIEKLDQVVKGCGYDLENVLIINYITITKDNNNNAITLTRNRYRNYYDWEEIMIDDNFKGKDMEFEEFDFDIPLYIVYSSGTTGKPKCIVHGAGGSLIQHLKEHILHGGMRSGDVFLQYTTIGWMMWQWMVSSLAVGVTLVLYDGSPFKPESSKLWELIHELGVTHFGTSAKYLQTLQETNFTIPQNLNLTTLRVIFSTGSPLPYDTFKYIYQKFLKDLDVQLASITGGTDILSLFAGGCPILPVYAGEIQVPCLGMALACDELDGGKGIFKPDLTLKQGHCGDLVCLEPFPSQPICFWSDDSIRKEKYRAAYFSSPSCPNVWHHGDYFCFSPGTGGLVMLGRSDGTLNPAGVRFGSADLYAICGKENYWIVDSLAVGVKLNEWKDEKVFLFLLLKSEFTSKNENDNNNVIPEHLLLKLKDQIKTKLSPRHVPAHIQSVPSIPYTLNGKKIEVSIKRILNGDFDLEIGNLSNPESLKFYREFGRKLHATRNNKL